ncbi:hypothetical protein [Joinjakaka virus]|uniref:Uncharacterized protein n=1 Tax=Joinjakaka virus TaxID=1272943 RepID=A0A0D3R1K6_9RHAB|nr:hypothetical protein [Joinjakaka virus]AJR28538.1 hypothetical protein [Joinjakaka virus]
MACTKMIKVKLVVGHLSDYENKNRVWNAIRAQPINFKYKMSLLRSIYSDPSRWVQTVIETDSHPILYWPATDYVWVKLRGNIKLCFQLSTFYSKKEFGPICHYDQLPKNENWNGWTLSDYEKLIGCRPQDLIRPI